MARQITVLEQNADVASGTRTLKVVFWFPISPANKQVPIPGFVSRATNVSAPEQSDLEAGIVREENLAISFPSTYTTTQMKALVNQRYTDRAAAVAVESAARAFYGVTYDSVTAWSA